MVVINWEEYAIPQKMVTMSAEKVEILLLHAKQINANVQALILV